MADLSHKIFSLLVPGYKVHRQMLLLRFCGSFVLFCIAVNAVIFPGSTPLTPLFFRLITASVANFDRR